MRVLPGVAVAIAAYVVGMIALLQYQLHRLRCSDTNAAMTLGMVRMIADIVSTSSELEKTVFALENSRFRSLGVTVFTEQGEVIMDSSAPCARPGLDPVPATARQLELLRSVSADEAKQPPSMRTPFLGSVFRPCAPASSNPELTTYAAMRSGPHLVVVTACGHEG